MKIYTKTDDDGTTGTFGGDRVSKSDPRIDVLGHIDELNAAIGIARSQADNQELDFMLERVQRELFELGAEIGCPSDSPYFNATIKQVHIELLEKEMDAAELPPLRDFILPGGTKFAAAIHLARTIARRAERVLIASNSELRVRQEPLVYLNRLSDWLFVLARSANHRAGVEDVKWKEIE